MASANTCETCGLTVPPHASVCPRDGTVLLSRPAPAPGEDSLEAPVPGVDGALDGTAPSYDPLVRMKLGEYELRQRIGVGGMGLVYDGIQPVIGKRVAVKVLRPELAQNPEQVARLLAEARAVNAIRHRGIIDIFGFGQVPDGRQYIVMEYLDGTPLDAYLAEKRKLPVQEALSILDEVLAALGAAHGAGVVHRDLKPSNIFLVRQPDGSRYVKLLDFGLAKQAQNATGRTAQTRTDMVVGTPEYMAPEQARGQEVGPMTDLYAMGVVTFEMVTGQLPFTGTSPVDLLMKHVDARPPRPSEYNPELPAALDAFILQMLTKDPETRPGSADALRQQLGRLRRGLGRTTRVGQRATAAAGAAASPEPAAPPATPKPAAPAVPDVDSRRRTTPVPALAVEVRPSTQEVQAAAGVHSSPARRLLPVGIGAAVLLALGGAVVAWRGTRDTPAPTPPAPFVVAPTPAEPQPQPVEPPPAPPTEPPAAAQPPPVVAEPTPPAPVEPPKVEPAPAPPVVARPATPPPQGTGRPRPEGSGPSREALITRIQTLERDVEARIAAGQRMSPAALSTLEKLRVAAREAHDVRSRREVVRKLNGWEKLFLKR